MLDLHCHILPGLDEDATPDLDSALALARLAVADGVTTLVATPHLLPHEVERSTAIRGRVAGFSARLREAGLPLEVLPGAEVVATWELLDHLDTLPRLGSQDRYLLLETPFAGVPDFLPELIFALQVRGLQPVLAHPERSPLARERFDLLLRLAETGCPLQINVTSLTGRQGWLVKRLALRLLRRVPGCVIASDAHDALYRPPLLSPARRAFRSLGGEERFRQVTEEYPRRILAGEKLP